MFKNFLLLLSIVSIFLINIDFYSVHHHNHIHENCEVSTNVVFECEDCQYIDNIKNNLIDNSNDYLCKENFSFKTFIFSDFIDSNKLELNSLSRAPPLS